MDKKEPEEGSEAFKPLNLKLTAATAEEVCALAMVNWLAVQPTSLY
jgi:hypothetical protein